MTRFLVLLGLLLAGCASTPLNYYTLAFVAGVPQSSLPLVIELRRVGVAAYLDRPEIVRSPTAYRLQVSDVERWAEPLGRMLERVFAEDLVQRLPGASVFAESGRISADADRVIELDIQRLDADDAGNVVLVAQLAVRRDGRSRPVARILRLTAPALPGLPMAAVVSVLVGQIADAAAGLVAGQGG
ncbi:MAG: membrane integrity-associated transporter subunit PqiC [Acetobacteraceae bacterium]|nr:membrane integrity-associated transporter subunit PqiC [Acetobacteraceae bacterium]